MKSGVAWRNYSTVARCAELAQALVCERALVAMATVAAGTLLCK